MCIVHMPAHVRMEIENQYRGGLQITAGLIATQANGHANEHEMWL